jgi:hypothetical protein
LKKIISENKIPLLLFLAAFVARLIAWPWSDSTDADAASRVLLSENLSDKLTLIKSGYWPSLPYYFNAAFIKLFQNRVLGPEFLSILLGALSIVPFYLFCRNIANAKGALWASLIFTFSSPVFRLSFMPLSETHYLFFTLCGLYFFSEALKQERNLLKQSFIAGLFMTIAAGARFETWLVIAVLALTFLFTKRFRQMFAFCFVASIFPLFWLWGNWLDFGDPLYSIHAVEKYNLNVGKINEGFDKTSLFRRITFFPLSWMIAITPVTALIIIIITLKSISRKILTPIRITSILLFLIFIPIFIYKCINGSLYMTHRFTITWVMFSVPLFSLWFINEKNIKIKSIISAAIVILLIPFSFVWDKLQLAEMFSFNKRMQHVMDLHIHSSKSQSRAIPMLHNPETKALASILKNNHVPGEGLIIDWINWEDSYFIAVNSFYKQNEQLLISPASANENNMDEVLKFLSKFKKGAIVLNDFSKLQRLLTGGENQFFNSKVNRKIQMTLIQQSGHVRIYKYEYFDGKETPPGFLNPTYTPTLDNALLMTKVNEDENLVVLIKDLARLRNKPYNETLVEECAKAVKRLTVK